MLRVGLSLVVGLVLLELLTEPFGGFTEMGFWERTPAIVVTGLVMVWIGQPGFDQIDRRKRERRAAQHNGNGAESPPPA